MNLNLETAKLLKLALDWKNNPVYKDIAFDLINMKWRCVVCFEAKMHDSTKWKNLDIYSTGVMKRHLGKKKSKQGQRGNDHEAALTKLGRTPKVKKSQEEFQQSVNNAQELAVKQKGSRERKCATMARLLVLVGTKRLSLVSFYELHKFFKEVMQALESDSTMIQGELIAQIVNVESDLKTLKEELGSDAIQKVTLILKLSHDSHSKNSALENVD